MVSYSRMPYEPPGDVPGPLFFSNATTGEKRPTSAASVVGVCIGVLLLPCLAVGAFWAVVSLIDAGPF